MQMQTLCVCCDYIQQNLRGKRLSGVSGECGYTFIAIHDFDPVQAVSFKNN